MIRLGVTLVCFMPLIGWGQTVTWDGDLQVLEFGSQVKILKETSPNLTLEEVSSQAYQTQFYPSMNQNISLGYSESFFWLNFKIDNVSDEVVLVELAQAGLPEVDVYRIAESGDTVHQRIGYKVSIVDRPYKSIYQIIEVPKGKHEYFIRLNSNSEPIPMRLLSERQFDVSSLKLSFSYGIYLGLMLFVVISNLFFYITHKRSIYLLYSFVSLIYISYAAAVIDGFIIYIWPQADLFFFYTTIPAIGIIVQTIYCLYFLNAKKYVPQLYSRILWVIVYFVVWAGVKYFFPFSIVQPVNTLNALISFFVMGFVGVRVGMNGNKFGYYFAIAYFIYFFLVSCQAIYINTGSPAYIGGLSHVAIATLIEGFILSFLLSKRTDWEKAEAEKQKKYAQEKSLLVARENQKLIQEQNLLLEKKVKDRTMEVARQNEELQNINRTKDRFFSIISHDLRGPVGSLVTLSNLLGEAIDSSDKDELQSYTRMIETSSVRLSELLDNLLNWAMSQEGKYPYFPESIKAQQLIDQVTSVFKSSAESKGVELESSLDDDLNVWVDKNSSTTILRNLVGNALKFTPNGGSITVSAKSSGAHMLFEVRDTGVGIPTDKMNSIFDFKDGKSTWGTDGEKGVGLGLQLVREFTVLNDGEVWLDSEEGKGTSFYLKLPLYHNNI